MVPPKDYLCIPGYYGKMRAFAVFIIAVLTAVTVPLALADGSDADYEERTVKMHLSPDDARDIQCRFYDDLPDIPYVKFEDIFETAFITVLQVNDNGDGTFTMENEFGVSALFDTVGDTVSSDNYSGFMFLHIPDNYRSKEPIFPVQQHSTEIVIAPSPTVFDLSAYNLDMRGDHGVWVPVTVASDLLCGPYLTHLIYTGTNLYFHNSHHRWGDSDLPWQMFKETVDRIRGDKAERSADMIDFSYNELCFRMDNFWGNIGRTEFSRLAESVGLDNALDTYSDGSRGVKALLLSEDDGDYAVGLNGLDRLVYDGGHTQLGIIPTWYLRDVYLNQDDYMEYRLSGLSLPEVPDRSITEERVRQARADAWGEGDYHVSGDTAVFSIDTISDSSRWGRYYSEGGDYPDDTLGNLLRAMDAASADPAVRNFVIDLSLCQGGSVNTTMAILGVITGQAPTEWVTDRLTGAGYADHYRVDTNLDGVYDECDLQKRYDFNFGILTSRLSYSAGNILAISAKGSGVTIMGERSGGGPSNLMKCADPEGFTEYMSSFVMHTGSDFDYRAFDSGVEPDVLIAVTESDGVPDYSALYDFKTLSRIMNEQNHVENTHSATLTVPAAALVVLAMSILIGGMRRKP